MLNTIRAQFPVFAANPKLVYLDSAATAQKPDAVINAVSSFYSNSSANVHRGLYPLAEEATRLFDHSRNTIAQFIGVKSEEVVFCGGTTDAINGIAQSLSNSGLISNSPQIIVSSQEHHSNLLPWQQIPGATLHYIPTNKQGELDLSQIDVSRKYDILAISLASNVTGKIYEVKKIKHQLKPKFMIVDAAQAVGHMPVDVTELDADFLAFSGHKLYGPTGVGVLFGKEEHLNSMPPFRTGGGMIDLVERQRSSWDKPPHKFEAGTPPIAQAIGLAAAAAFVQEVGIENIQQHEAEIISYCVKQLNSITGNSLFTAANTQTTSGLEALGIVSFSIEGIHAHDIAQVLGDRQICVRAGHHCTQIFHRETLQVPATARVSLGMYNTKQDIDLLAQGIQDVIAMFK